MFKTLFRYLSAVSLGAVATFGLLILMRSVIADPMPAENSGVTGDVLEFVRLVKEREPILKDRTPKPPPKPDEPPPPLPPLDPNIEGPTFGLLDPPEPTLPSKNGLFDRQMDDGTYLPIVRVQPIYPRRALTRGIEGYVLVEFVVTATGAVQHPMVVVADPPGFFERAALSAVLKFKYKPRVTNGEPVAVSGVRTRVVFEMED